MSGARLVQRIEICGGIASGKTTLANLLARLDIEPILENFQTNPFWQAFYNDPAGTAFETEITFLLQHYHEIKAAEKLHNKLVCDFSLLLDLSYAYVTLPQDKLEVFLTVYRAVSKELSPTRLLIYLKCDPNIELNRIRQRGRDVESSITVEYLEQINLRLEKFIESYVGELFVVDSGLLDFANDEDIKKSLLRKIDMRLSDLYTFGTPNTHHDL